MTNKEADRRCIICLKSLLKRQKKYCTVICQAVGCSKIQTKSREKRNCLFCKEIFECIPVKKRKYCSRVCKDIHQKESYEKI